MNPILIYAATPLLLNPSQGVYPLGKHMEFLEDVDGQLTIEQVSSSEFSSSFQSGSLDAPNFGNTHSVYWAYLQVLNPLPSSTMWYLEQAFPIIDHVSLFIQQVDGTFLKYTAGDQYPFEQRDVKHRNIIFPLSLPSQHVQTLYIRVKSESSMQMSFKLWNPETFLENSTEEHSGLGLYYGMILVMLIYNLFLFTVIRDRSYLYYVLHTAGLLLYQMVYNGLAYRYLWPDSPSWTNKSLPFFLAFTGFWGISFFRSFVDSAKILHGWDKLLIFLSVILAGLMPLSLFVNTVTSGSLVVLSAMNSYVIILWVSFLAVLKGSRPARFFLLSFSLFLLGGLASALRSFGILPMMFITNYGPHIGSALEVIFLSFGLADRVNTMKKERFVAQQKLLEAQQEVLKAEHQSVENLKRVDKLKDEFLANTSHELRTPLNGIIGLAESLVDGATGKLSKATSENLELIIQSGKRLANLVNDILDFSKMKNHELQLQFRPVDLKSITEVVLKIASTLLGKKQIILRTEIPDTLPFVYADENRLQQIFMNLIGNAIKFTHQGEILLKAEQQESRIWLSVSDTGIGIQSDQQERIFEVFEQADGSTSREYGGTGLGLSITRKLVEAHGGKILVDSTPGQGSIFWFDLPVYAEDLSLPAKAADQQSLHAKQAHIRFNSWEQDDHSLSLNELMPLENQQDNKLKAKTILVVDDEPINIKVLQNHLQLNNYRVLTAQDGFEALELFHSEHPDLVLLDLMMPRMNGYEVALKLRQNHPPAQLPILMLTAKNQVSDLVKGFDSGANDYLTKPFHKAELLSRINLHLQLQNSIESLKELLKKEEAFLVTFKKFVPNQFLRRIASEGIENIELGKAEHETITILFSDIRGFTSLSEMMSPQELLNFLNDYFKKMTIPIHENNGFIDKFIGDAIMALFDFPGQNDAVEAISAVKAAIGMQDVLTAYNQQRQILGIPPVATGIGIHSGPVIIGTVGAQDRMDSTVLGDTVNLASRLEGLTKKYHAQIIISDQTWNFVQHEEGLLWRELDLVKVLGKEQSITIYEIFNANENTLREKKTRILKPYREGLKLYLSRKWNEARRLFEECLNVFPEDIVSQNYLARCVKYQQEPPDESWNGSERLTEK
ncbi:MAG: response regulator [SAR324 cluster bacterium]|nr:response regulator [SAR324 cluster bacterium]